MDFQYLLQVCVVTYVWGPLSLANKSKFKLTAPRIEVYLKVQSWNLAIYRIVYGTTSSSLNYGQSGINVCEQRSEK